jgi:hypothetical protein
MHRRLDVFQRTLIPFVAKDITSANGYKDNKILISQIARKHIISTVKIDHRQIDRLISGRVISSKGKTQLLLEQGKNSKD